MPNRKTKMTKRTEGSSPLPSLKSPSSLPRGQERAHTFIPPHGGYENLLSFQKARIVYDGTVRFCERLLQKRDRTYDQMIQAARSGKQNILEGSQASGTSKETEIKLTNVARASLEKLLEDYRDFLRLRGIEEWTKEHRYTRRLRQLNRQPITDHALAHWITSSPNLDCLLLRIREFATLRDHKIVFTARSI